MTGRRGRIGFWSSTRAVEFLGLTHRGYEEQGVTHRRCYLVNRKKHYAVVLDFLDSDDTHRYEWIMNTPERVKKAKSGASGRSLAVVAAEPGEIDRVGITSATMALPLAGKTTWGMPREEGRNIRIAKKGDSVRYAVLVMPRKRPGAAGISVEQVDGRSRYRLRITVEGPGFTDTHEVNCRTGEIGDQR